MVHPPPDFMPLDPGRIHADDPMEIASEDVPGRTTRGRLWPIQPLHAMVCRAPRKPAARATPLDLEMHR
jgi:hypothetical protein